MLAVRRVVVRSGSLDCVVNKRNLHGLGWTGLFVIPVVIILLLAVWSRVASAQVTPALTWSQQSPATSPSVRLGATMAYDPSTNQVVLFGGQGSNGNTLNDTWNWNGTTWTQLSPATSPPSREDATMAYDPNSGQVVLFGGLNNNGNGTSLLGDTWTWNGTTWTPQTPATSPQARFYATMAYDPSSGQVVLFGGETVNSDFYVGDTWTWNGSTWTPQNPATSPPSRGTAMMAYNVTSGQVLLFGGDGNGTGFPFLNDTWTWSGATWTQLSRATSPPSTGQAVMAYDANSGQMVLFGGANNAGLNILGDTWTWNGTTWTQQTPATSPEARYSAAMAYDPSSGQVVLFGGSSNSNLLGDTWSLQQGPANLGSANVCMAGATTPSPCSQTITLAFDVAAGTTISSISILTQGAPNLDFKAATTQKSNACATQTYQSATTCTVTVTFAPEHPGQRLGAVVIQDSADDPPATTYVFGTGQGPQLTFSPPTQSTIPATGLLHPQGMAVDSSGNVYIADSNNNRVLKETLSGGSYTQSTIPATGLAGPEGVAVDGAGNVYIANTEGGSGGNGNVLLETLSGGSYTQSTIPATGLMSPIGVAADDSGNVYIANFGGGGNGNVLLETLSGGSYTQSTIPATGLAGPIGVAVDGSGNVYIANLNGGSGATGNVLKETLSGGSYTQSTIPATGLLGPEGVTVDSNGNVYIANTSGGSGTGNVLKETLSGGSYTQSTIPATGLDFPTDVAVDSSGNVYIANFGDGSSQPGTVLMENYADTPTLTFPASTNDGATDTTDGPLSVTITNDGNELLRAISPGLSVAANFTQSVGSGTPANCTASFSLAANASCNISIEFAPVAPAGSTVNGSVTLTDNNLNATPSTMQQIPLIGTAVEATPTVTGISPASGPAAGGTVVTITGTNFTGATSVSFGGASASFTVNSATSIIATSPAGTGTVDVVVTNSSGSSATSAADRFTYIPTLILSPVSLPAATAETAYSQTLTASGGTAPYTYAVSSGALPAGISLNPTTGVLSGTPTAAGSFSFTITATDSSASPGPYKGTATYSLTVNAGTTTLTFAAVPAQTYGNPPFMVSANSASTGAITYSVVSGPATVVASTGVAILTGAGAVTIEASQAATASYNSATTMTTILAAKQATQTSVSASPTVATPVQTVTLTATVSATIAGTPATPTGAVIFLDNGVQLGATVNVVGGIATLVVPSLPTGTAVITAMYSGDGNFLASTSSNSASVVVASLDFTFTNTGTSAYTAAPGAMATYNFALAPLSGSYPGPVSFSVTGLPTGATASFTPSSVAANGGATPVMMTVQTAAATAHNNSPFGRGIVLAFLLLPFVAKRSVRQKMKGRMLLLVLLMAGVTATLTGCGSTNGFLLQSQQTYTLTVTATSGALQHSQIVTLIVQ